MEQAAVDAGVDASVGGPVARAATSMTAADKCELQLQDTDQSGVCSFYTRADLEAMECQQMVVQEGDTLYIPKGMVHYAESGALPPLLMHAVLLIILAAHYCACLVFFSFFFP